MTDAGPSAERPTAAGIYDVYLGGSDNTESERAAAERLRQVLPYAADSAWANRSFHQKATRWLAEQGITQFIDLGAGLPTQDNTHQVVHRVAPEARVVYVDHEDRTVTRAQELIANLPTVRFVKGDIRDVDGVLNDPALREIIDFDQPVALLCTAIVHFVDERDDPWGVVDGYVKPLAPGSYLALTHLTADKQSPKVLRTINDVYRNANEMIHLRNRDQVEWFFRGLQLVPPYEGAPPKVTFVGLWGCEDPKEADDDSGRWLYCGVARKP
ncbi:MAG: SAM-dependent methyltransferase [Streptosporangiales bacterium]|nr:SAM-dependent methyltransferase [Streptosporangiales bacterium]MBO0891655.1 SAM-dependent methyltransferase [Acidothermales bacterium]